MAKLTPGIGFAAASGKIQGTVFNFSGQKQQTRLNVGKPRKPTTLQAIQAARLASFAQQWRTLSEAQRSKWNEFAEQLRSGGNKFNGPNLGGFQTFVSCNMNLIESGQPTLTVPSTLRAQGTFSISSTGYHIIGPAWPVTVANLVAPSAVKLLYASKPVSAGRSNFSGEPLRLIAVIAGTGTAQRFPQYTAAWFSLDVGSIGKIIYCRAQAVNLSGLRGPIYEFTSSITN